MEKINVNVGDRVLATMNGKDWFHGVYKKESGLFANYGVLLDKTGEIRYFVDIKKQ